MIKLYYKEYTYTNVDILINNINMVIFSAVDVEYTSNTRLILGVR